MPLCSKTKLMQYAFKASVKKKLWEIRAALDYFEFEFKAKD